MTETLGLVRANQAVARAKRAADAAALASDKFDASGIKAAIGQWLAQLPEGQVQIFAPFFDDDGNLLAGFDPDLNWLASGLRLLTGGALTLGNHAIGSSGKSDFPIRFSDADGNQLLLLDRDLRWWLNHLRVMGDAEVDNLDVGSDLTVGGAFAPQGGIGAGDARMLDGESNYPWSVHDDAGNVFAGVYEDDFHLMHVGPSVRLRLLFDNARNVARTAATFGNAHNVQVAAFTAIRALLIMAGQSLSNGYEGWPAVSKVAHSAMAYMFGLSVRPANGATGGGFSPQGGSAALNPIVGTVEHVGDANRVPMTDAQIAAIDPAVSNTYEGENGIVAIANGISRYWEILPGAPARKFIGASTGYGGHAIEQLQQGRNEYLRTTQLLDLHVAQAQAAGETWNVPLFFWWQGEANYGAGTIDGVVGGTPIINDKAGYKAQLATYRTNLIAQISTRGQTAVPAMFIAVTSGSWVNDTFAASISMAQVEFALETPGAWCIGPYYPVTDKGGHLDANGYRWMGCQAAKIVRRVMIDRKGHEPLYPYKIEAVGRSIFVHMGGAVGAVQFQPIYAGNGTTAETSTMFADKGFRVADAGGWLNILSVGTIASTIIEIVCDRAPDLASGMLWYADRALHVGGGNLCDSDPTRAEELYEYLAGTGMYAVSNIAALVGNPYPLFNWCSPFVLPLTYSR